MNKKYELHVLSVLRGVCDGDSGKYFGSTMNLIYWIDKAKDEGLVAGDNTRKLEPTIVGKELYDKVLSKLQNGRATFWSGKELEDLLK